MPGTLQENYLRLKCHELFQTLHETLDEVVYRTRALRKVQDAGIHLDDKTIKLQQINFVLLYNLHHFGHHLDSQYKKLYSAVPLHGEGCACTKAGVSPETNAMSITGCTIRKLLSSYPKD